MGIQDEPSLIDGKPNPVFGVVKMMKTSDLPLEHDFRHEHFWNIEKQYDGLTDVICECGKGKTIDKHLTVVSGKIVGL